MNKLKSILLLFTVYCLLFTVKAQQIEWIVNFKIGTSSAAQSIDYSTLKKGYIYAGGSSIAPLYGVISELGDTVFTQLYPLDSLWFGMKEVYENQSQTATISRTSLAHPINFWDYTNNVSKFDYEGNLIWRTDYVDSYSETWRPRFIPLADGGAMVSGYIGGSLQDPYMARIDRDGNKLFENVYYQYMFQVTEDFQLHKDGSFWISGRENPASGIENAFMMKLDVNGNLLQKDTIPEIFPSKIKNHISEFSITNDGSILCEYLYEESISSFKSYIMKLDSNYNEIWRSAIDPEVSKPILLDNGKVFTYGRNHVKLYNYTTGNLNWEYSFPDTNNGTPYFTDYAFDDSGSVVLCGRLDKQNNKDDMYFAKIANIGSPVKRSCVNAPTIHTLNQEILSFTEVKLTATATENLKYSDILAYYWHFEDGTTQQGDSVILNLETACPTPFWAMLVVADGVGCTDTLTIDVCYGNVIDNPEWPVPNSVDEKIKEQKSTLKVYPNPFTETFTLLFDESLKPLKYNEISVFSILGQKIHIPQQIQNDKVILDGSSLQKGIYIVEVEGIGRTKIVKN